LRLARLILSNPGAKPRDISKAKLCLIRAEMFAADPETKSEIAELKKQIVE